MNNMEEKVLLTYRPKVLLGVFITFCVLVIAFSFLLFNTIFSLWVNPYHYYGVDAKKMQQLHSIISDLS